MVCATLEAPIRDYPERAASQPSVLQLRFLNVIESVGPLVDALEAHTQTHPQIGDFEVPLVDEWRPLVPNRGVLLEDDMRRLTIHGLLLGEYESDHKIGGAPRLALPSLKARRIAGYLVTPKTIYRHDGFRYETPDGLIIRDTLRDLVPHRSVDALPNQAQAVLDNVVTEAEHVAMRLSVAYGIGADLPVFKQSIF